jgi:hypothetical protein
MFHSFVHLVHFCRFKRRNYPLHMQQIKGRRWQKSILIIYHLIIVLLRLLLIIVFIIINWPSQSLRPCIAIVCSWVCFPPLCKCQCVVALPTGGIFVGNSGTQLNSLGGPETNLPSSYFYCVSLIRRLNWFLYSASAMLPMR